MAKASKVSIALQKAYMGLAPDDRPDEDKPKRQSKGAVSKVVWDMQPAVETEQDRLLYVWDEDAIRGLHPDSYKYMLPAAKGQYKWWLGIYTAMLDADDVPRPKDAVDEIALKEMPTWKSRYETICRVMGVTPGPTGTS